VSPLAGTVHAGPLCWFPCCCSSVCCVACSRRSSHSFWLEFGGSVPLTSLFISTERICLGWPTARDLAVPWSHARVAFLVCFLSGVGSWRIVLARALEGRVVYLTSPAPPSRSSYLSLIFGSLLLRESRSVLLSAVRSSWCGFVHHQ